MSAVPLAVTAHVRRRVRERWPGFTRAQERIETEIGEAFASGSISPYKPNGLPGESDPRCLYASTPEGRIYVLLPGDDVFVVLTALVREAV